MCACDINVIVYNDVSHFIGRTIQIRISLWMLSNCKIIRHLLNSLAKNHGKVGRFRDLLNRRNCKLLITKSIHRLSLSMY